MKSVKRCIECNTQTKKTVSFGIFPKEDYKWCSKKCLCKWIVRRNMMNNDEFVSEIIDKKGRVTRVNDLIKMDDF